jgi:hypothetical protein
MYRVISYITECEDYKVSVCTAGLVSADASSFPFDEVTRISDETPRITV